MSYNNMGVFDGGIITPKQTQPVGMPVMDAAAVSYTHLLTDMLVEALTGQSAEQEKLVPGVR